MLISGEPGIGKSRMTAALAARIGGEPHTRVRYFCSPHHQDSALHPFIAQLERAADFARNDTPEQKLSKLKGLIANAARDRDEVTLLAELLSLPNDAEELNVSPQRKREKLFDALLRQLEAIAKQRPVLFVFEDAHWMDPTSRELLDLTVERVPALPVLAVITFRPEFQPPWAGQTQVTTLMLNRLSGRDGAALIERLVGSTGVPTGLIAEIVERADGVPLFIEELTKAVLENDKQHHRVAAILSATPSAAIPATLHASLIARLDRLGAVARETAQIGSILGREFAYDLIQPVAQRAEIDLQASLAQLTEAGLLFCRGAPPHASYLFKHALVQDAAYGTLLRARRQELHARAAAILEQHFDDLVERQPEVLARHFTEAHQLDKAVAYWSRAGQQAVAKGSLVEAMEQLRRGLRLAEELPDTPERNQHILDCRLTLAYALLAAKGYSHSDVLHAFNEAAKAASGFEGNAPLDRFSILYGLFSVYYVRGEAQPSLARAKEFLALAETQPLSAPQQVGHRLIGTALMMNADCRKALPHLQRAISIYSAAEHRGFAARFGQDIGVASCSLAAWTLWFCGYPDRASRMADQARCLAKQTGHALSLNFALFWSCATGCLLRHPEQVKAFADESIELAERHGFQFWVASGRVYQCWATTPCRKTPGIVDSFRSSLAGLKNWGCRLLEPFFLGLLAEVCGMTGEVDAGHSALDEAFAVSTQTGQIGFDAELHRLRGELLRKLPNADLPKCEACFHEAMIIAHQQGVYGYELRAATSLARLWGEQAKQAEARDVLARVYGRFTEGFDTTDMIEARTLIDASA
jgi:predicted ATPase